MLFRSQFGVAAPQWALAVAYRYGSCGQAESLNGTINASGSLPCGNGDNALSSTLSNVANSSNVALTAAWQPALSLVVENTGDVVYERPSKNATFSHPTVEVVASSAAGFGAYLPVLVMASLTISRTSLAFHRVLGTRGGVSATVRDFCTPFDASLSRRFRRSPSMLVRRRLAMTLLSAGQWVARALLPFCAATLARRQR